MVSLSRGFGRRIAALGVCSSRSISVEVTEVRPHCFVVPQTPNGSVRAAVYRESDAKYIIMANGCQFRLLGRRSSRPFTFTFDLHLDFTQ